MNRRLFLKASVVAPIGLVVPSITPATAAITPPVSFPSRNLTAEAEMAADLMAQGLMSVREARAFFGLPEDTEL